jgi:sulfur carrier protein
MKVTINGQATELIPPATVLDVLTKLALPSNQVAVEINKRLVRRCDHQATAVNNGDVIEIVTLVGGG